MSIKITPSYRQEGNTFLQEGGNLNRGLKEVSKMRRERTPGMEDSRRKCAKLGDGEAMQGRARRPVSLQEDWQIKGGAACE